MLKHDLLVIYIMTFEATNLLSRTCRVRSRPLRAPKDRTTLYYGAYYGIYSACLDRCGVRDSHVFL